MPSVCNSGELERSAWVADRAAVERVYYSHRTGTKPPFESALPRETIERLVRDDLRKETALKQIYHVAIPPALLEAEVQRINSTTRAPDVLAELRAALGNDPTRFAQTVARPILVERLLRERFDNDDSLHAARRREMEAVRTRLTNAAAQFRDGRRAGAPGSPPHAMPKAEPGRSLLPPGASPEWVETLLAMLKEGHSNEVSETRWELGARPKEQPGADSPDQLEIRRSFGSDAQVLSASPPDGKEGRFYFEDLAGELQRVLRAQLRQAGDVSAVIEMPTGFLLYVAKERTSEALSVAALSLPKRSYEQWLAEQDEGDR